MKKVTLSNPNADVIKFLVRGQRGSASAVELEIDAEGVIVDEADAAVVAERLGGNVTISDVDIKKVAAAALGKVEPTPEEIAAEEARRAALSDEERAAEDEAKAKAEVDAKAAAKAAKAAEKAAKAAAKKAK